VPQQFAPLVKYHMKEKRQGDFAPVFLAAINLYTSFPSPTWQPRKYEGNYCNLKKWGKKTRWANKRFKSAIELDCRNI